MSWMRHLISRAGVDAIRAATATKNEGLPPLKNSTKQHKKDSLPYCPGSLEMEAGLRSKIDGRSQYLQNTRLESSDSDSDINSALHSKILSLLVSKYFEVYHKDFEVMIDSRRKR
mmetsp:Transcript_4583/g.11124  ORF Transcript_4583/g.11124 Transcript_4583/m.11124 type:complete len:115 (-) Transcript_4583:1270-1614(-)